MSSPPEPPGTTIGPLAPFAMLAFGFALVRRSWRAAAVGAGAVLLELRWTAYKRLMRRIALSRIPIGVQQRGDSEP